MGTGLHPCAASAGGLPMGLRERYRRLLATPSCNFMIQSHRPEAHAALSHKQKLV